MGHRLLRINESIKETLSSVITAEGLKDPRVGFVTVTGVETTPDLRHAKVYVSVLGGRVEREATLKALEKARGVLQAHINRALHMKRTPQLQFLYDETLDNALRIDRALKREAEVLGEEPREIPVPGMEPDEPPAAGSGDEDELGGDDVDDVIDDGWDDQRAGDAEDDEL
jgi:ribosome-binding factor A